MAQETSSFSTRWGGLAGPVGGPGEESERDDTEEDKEREDRCW